LRKFIVVLIVVLFAIALALATSGKFLVVDDLRHADVIVVLAGETNHRPKLGLELLGQGYAPRMLLDVPANEVIYNRNLTDIAQEFVQLRSQGRPVSICPIYGLSTKAETHDVEQCLSGSGIRRILLVTSDYHTRRARIIFRHQLPGSEIFVTPAHDPQQYGPYWWQHRQWAKTSFDETTKFLWWELVDRWR
jgi:hypothetical protein